MSILRALSPVGRGVLVATLAVSVLSVAIEWLLHVEGTPVFLVSALGILGLAYVVGAATERLGALAGPQVGGILNATFGNVAELIIAFFAMAAGELEGGKGSLTGSVVGNPLLVLGFSLFLGGLRNGQQRFSPKVAGLDATLLVLAVIGLFVPAVFALSAGGSAGAEPRTLENVSVALVLLVLYALNLVYRLRHPEEGLGGGDPARHARPPPRPGVPRGAPRGGRRPGGRSGTASTSPWPWPSAPASRWPSSSPRSSCCSASSSGSRWTSCSRRWRSPPLRPRRGSPRSSPSTASRTGWRGRCCSGATRSSRSASSTSKGDVSARRPRRLSRGPAPGEP